MIHRHIAAVLLMALTATTVHAIDDVQEPRLRVQNLTRPDGKQSATLTGWTPPGASSRPVTVTLQVGDATVTLAGKISRSGRLRAVGRRLALTTALASFARIDLDVSGALTASLTMGSSDCLRTRRGRQLECPPPPGTLVDGVYDLVVADRTPVGRSEVASLRTVGDRRDLILYESEYDYTFLEVAPDLGLSGYYVSGDVGFSVEGSGVDRSTPSVARLSGDLSSPFPYPPDAFIMERPVAGTPNTFDGTWNVALVAGGFGSMDGSMALTLAVPPSGKATTAPTSIEQTTGPRYTISGDTCDVAPAGGIHCSLSITDPPGRYMITLHGFLDVGAGTGQGRFVEGSAPMIYAEGTWTASR